MDLPRVLCITITLVSCCGTTVHMTSSEIRGQALLATVVVMWIRELHGDKRIG